MKLACILSNQKSSVAVCLAHHLLTGEAPVSELGTTISPSTMAEWSVLLGEVDKALLRKKLASSSYKCHIFADDSSKHGEDHHMVSVHTWCDKNGGPVGYVLANTLVQSGSGANQAAVDEHVLRDIYGISGVCGVVGDNASTRSGNKQGHAAELGSQFKTNTVFLPCYSQVLNIALRNAMVEGFGQRGGTLSFNLFQLHYKVGYVHHQRPTYYKSLSMREFCQLRVRFVKSSWRLAGHIYTPASSGGQNMGSLVSNWGSGSCSFFPRKSHTFLSGKTLSEWLLTRCSQWRGLPCWSSWTGLSCRD